MIIAAVRVDVTIPETLGLSVLGMVIVFIILVFLMVIIYIMTAIIKKLTNKPIAVTESAHAPSTVLPPGEQISDAAVSPASTAEATVETAPILEDSAAIHYREPKFSTARKYRVVVNGFEYEVDAATGEAVPGSSASEPLDSATLGQAVPATTEETHAPMATAAQEFSGVRKYRVVVNGLEYEVDAATGDTITISGSERGL